VKSLRAVGDANVEKELHLIQKKLLNLSDDQFSVSKGLAPAYSPIKMVKMRRRFTFGTNFTGTITLADFYNQFLVATSATTAVCYIDGCLLKKLKIYCRNNEADYSCQVQLTPNGGSTDNVFATPPKTLAVESQSSALAEILTYIPRRNGPLGGYHGASATNSTSVMLSIATSSNGGSIDGNTVMDLEFEVMINIFGGLRSYSITGLSGLTVGALYGAAMVGGLIPTLDVNHI